MGLRPAPLRLRGVYSPTHYYVRVSRGGELHKHWPSSQVPALLHIARRGPRLAPHSSATNDDRKLGRRRWGRAVASDSPDDHRSSARGRPLGSSLAEGLPPENALLRTPRW